MSRSAFVTTLLSLSLLAPIGCAASADASGSDGVSASQDALMSDSSLVGKYYDRTVPSGGIARLNLDASGQFTASVDAGGTAECITAPCLLPESGTWSVAKKDGALSLHLSVQGASARSYDVRKFEGELDITAPDGTVQKLTMLDADQCMVDSDCNAGANEVCAPRVCAMLCASNSPFCCGASLCRVKSAD